MSSTTSQHATGLRSAGTRAKSTSQAISDLKAELGNETGYQLLLVLFSPDHNADAVSREVERQFPGVPFSGCTTSGEIGPHGMSEGGIVAIAFPHDGFRICAEAIEDIAHFGVERANETVRRLRSRLAFAGSRPADRDHQIDAPQPAQSRRQFALLLVDGLSNFEEMLVATVNWVLGDTPLVGGSSGDSLAFEQTTLIHNGRRLTDAAILILVETDTPFEVFRTHEFDPTPIKLVVTAADTERRIVHELNAEPAAAEYARSIGLVSTELDTFSFASHPLVVRIGDEYYCRSIREINDDGSLSFFCAIDDGLVFTVATPKDMIRSTERTLKEIGQRLGGLALVIGFDCILRRLDAERRQVRHRLEATYLEHNVVGFHTYGEQSNAMHLNQTLTGIAFGPPRQSSTDMPGS